MSNIFSIFSYSKLLNLNLENTLINLKYVDAVLPNYLVMINGEHFNLTGRRRNAFFERINKFFELVWKKQTFKDLTIDLSALEKLITNDKNGDKKIKEVILKTSADFNFSL